MSQTMITLLVVGLFLLIFPLMWLGITSLLMAISGWSKVAKRYPDREDTVLGSFGWQSGAIGPHPLASVNFRNVLTFEACSTGMRLKIMTLMAPFAKPILVPWDELSVKTRSLLIVDYYDLLFGEEGEGGHIMVTKKLGRRLAEASAGRMVLPRD
ncbi:hypothetical protein [Aurantiacibacter gilvus]|uniref:DUF2550 domain-containing protein n=1 Tax=Aurantiacibacter gilvus TaxID=3139141 RepID=A0ABU9IE77_9SPHN